MIGFARLDYKLLAKLTRAEDPEPTDADLEPDMRIVVDKVTELEQATRPKLREALRPLFLDDEQAALSKEKEGLTRIMELAFSEKKPAEAQKFLEQEFEMLKTSIKVGQQAKAFEQNYYDRFERQDYYRNLARISAISANLRSQSRLPEHTMSSAELNQFEYEFSFLISRLAALPEQLNPKQCKRILNSFIESYLEKNPNLLDGHLKRRQDLREALMVHLGGNQHFIGNHIRTK